MRWNAVRQIEKRGKPGPFAAAKLSYGDPIIGAPMMAQMATTKIVMQIVRLRALKPGIPQVGKMGCDTDTRLCLTSGCKHTEDLQWIMIP